MLLAEGNYARQTIQTIQSGAAGFDTGNGEKLSSTQPTPAWLLLSFSLFPVSNPAAPLCTATLGE